MHKALYRTYRPQTFEDMVGQRHIIKTLKNQIKNDNVGHAYLFTGTRGTGKTSTAKIFARAVNCINPNDQEPCNKCEVCESILNDNTMDTIEIDAASNNSVDDIRELRESVKYSPTNCKYKVYIIDEVHMLSQGAFNALLKTLEEPPSYVIFILATTEPHKIPATILSRCQRFDFKRVTINEMVKRMKDICTGENMEVEERALNLIASNSQGALRDALSILDQCMSFGEDKITYDDVVELMGTVNIEQLFDLSQYIIDQDIKKSLQSLNEFISWGKDIRNLINDLISHFRNIMVRKVSKDIDDILSLPEDTLERISKQSEGVDINSLIRILNVLSETQDSIKSSSNQRVMVEVAIMKIAQPIFDDSKESLLDRIENLEKIIESGNIKIASYQSSGEEAYEEEKIDPVIKTENKHYEEVKSEDVELVESSWKEVLKQIKKDKKMPIYALLTEAKNFNVHNNELFIVFDDKFSFAKDRLSAKETHEYIETVVRSIMKRNFSIKTVLASDIKNINFEVKEKKDKGVEILENIVDSGILEVKDKVEED
ncbi:DNA polymerase III subunit gamma/tau [Clostridioides mangenotii]|uniref:DNA polymerase III subunit gamma/tau n=1 Tax=Metaclostridioides mangenotii TaxID=1540 RepID=UPI001C122AFD|nr:DNA polymerase III subunit gamma/tau [Clostridioides mangenotii]MBU5308829.1 DNA polymerase III subunit gamma/tau [Clostridioides mangenotii]